MAKEIKTKKVQNKNGKTKKLDNKTSKSKKPDSKINNKTNKLNKSDNKIDKKNTPKKDIKSDNKVIENHAIKNNTKLEKKTASIKSIKTVSEKDTNAMKKDTNIKKKKVKWIWILVFIIGILIVAFECVNIFFWQEDNKETKKQIEELEQIAPVEEVPIEDELSEQVNPPTNPNNDYWNYIKLPLISVNFDELLQKNSDTVAFLKVNGTNINYPVVQYTDNEYYLTRSFDKKNNDAGWIFLDYRNDINNLGANTIIYGHSRLDTTMFGTLKNIFKNNWYKNTDNYVVNLSTPRENTLWQVFSVYSIPDESYYITTYFHNKKDHQAFIDTIVGRSKYNFNAEVNTDDKILTLSTCYTDNKRVVLHAKLIKKQIRE